jgi:hypothetical protein
MNDQELRQIVRQALAKHGVTHRGEARDQSRVPERAALSSQAQFVPESVPFGNHASHAMYMQLVNDNGGSCLIEPTVTCNHCGYCQSHGH